MLVIPAARSKASRQSVAPQLPAEQVRSARNRGVNTLPSGWILTDQGGTVRSMGSAGATEVNRPPGSHFGSTRALELTTAGWRQGLIKVISEV